MKSAKRLWLKLLCLLIAKPFTEHCYYLLLSEIEIFYAGVLPRCWILFVLKHFPVMLATHIT